MNIDFTALTSRALCWFPSPPPLLLLLLWRTVAVPVHIQEHCRAISARLLAALRRSNNARRN